MEDLTVKPGGYDFGPAHGFTASDGPTRRRGRRGGRITSSGWIFKAYNERGVLDPGATLSDMMGVLGDLPLTFHPGTSWEYSVATDVVARLVEVLGGRRLDEFIRTRMLDPPLGML